MNEVKVRIGDVSKTTVTARTSTAPIPYIGDNGNWYINNTDSGKPSRGVQGVAGKDGTNGTNGKDGYTPVRGTDYWTESDKTVIVSDTISSLGDTYVKVYNNAGAHNAIYRGKNLGTAVTDAQYAAIAAGTFEDLYIGDYWVINKVTWRIAAFDYYLRTGDAECTTHHVTIVPDVPLYTGAMNDTASTVGAYISSKMYTEGLEQAKTAINTAFGKAHILSHKLYLANSVNSGGLPKGRSWYDSTVELMTEQNVYGCKIMGTTGIASNYEIDKVQYPLFSHNPYLISNRNWFWLRDTISTEQYAVVNSRGDSALGTATLVRGVRPAFSIIG